MLQEVGHRFVHRQPGGDAGARRTELRLDAEVPDRRALPQVEVHPLDGARAITRKEAAEGSIDGPDEAGEAVAIGVSPGREISGRPALTRKSAALATNGNPAPAGKTPGARGGSGLPRAMRSATFTLASARSRRTIPPVRSPFASTS